MEIVSGEDKPAAKTESKLLPPMEKSFVIPLASPKIPSLGTDSNRGKVCVNTHYLYLLIDLLVD